MTQPSQEAIVNELHQAIMNIKCPQTRLTDANSVQAIYACGHRDARHAAAELANEFLARQVAARSVAGEPCRNCSVCEGASHHWIPDPLAEDDPDYAPGDYACKHCEQRGDGCEACDGTGVAVDSEMSGEDETCQECNGEGAISKRSLLNVREP